VSGYDRTGGNRRKKRAVRKPRNVGVDVFRTGQHIDPRMCLGIADIKRMHPELCNVPKSVTLIDDSNKWNRIIKTVPDRSVPQQPQEAH